MEIAKLIECPRDAWQGLSKVIPTEVKVEYLRKLIEAGFRHIDAVSFVSPKYVPQMADSEQVMQMLDDAGLFRPAGPGAAANPGVPAGEYRAPEAAKGRAATSDAVRKGGAAEGSSATHRASRTEPRAHGPEIIGIVVNERGLHRALAAPGVKTIGYPQSISERFLQQNAHLSRARSRMLVEKICHVTSGAGRNFVVYLSMAFGNPYGEPWTPETVAEEVRWLMGIGVRTVSLADTVGKAQPEQISTLLRAVSNSIQGFGEVEVGIHLHSRPEGAAEKIVAAYEAGCRRFDSALTGLGGCPFAGDELVGNIPTEIVVPALSKRGVSTAIEPWGLLAAVEATNDVRRKYAQGELSSFLSAH